MKRNRPNVNAVLKANVSVLQNKSVAAAPISANVGTIALVRRAVAKRKRT